MPEDQAPDPVLSGPKRQHYLTRWFLEGFVGDDGCVAVFDRVKCEIRRQQPINTGVTGHLYTLTDDQGRQRFELENALCQIEEAAARHFPALIAGERLSLEARGAIAHFFGVLAVRTPDFIQSIQNFNGEMIKRTAQILFSTEEQVLARLRKDPQHASKSEAELHRLASNMVDFTERGAYEVETNHEWAMTTAVPMGDKIAEILAERHWAVWQAPAGASFVCGDSPLVLTAATPTRNTLYGIGYGSANALVMVPLNSTHALAMYGDGRTQSVEKIDRRLVRQLNTDVARRVQRFLIARDNALADSISRAARMHETGWQPKLTLNPAPSKLAAKVGRGN